MKFLKYIIGASLAIGAQSASAQVLVGPEIGFTRSTMVSEIGHKQYSNSFVTGARAGVTFDIDVDGHFYLQPAANFAFLHGGRMHHQEFMSAGAGVPTRVRDEREYNLYTLNIPLYFVRKVDFQYHPHTLTFGIGPVFNFNFGGNYDRTYTTTLNGLDRPVYDQRDMTVGPNWGEHDIRMFELSAAAMIGYEMSNGFNLRLNYGLGLTNLAPGAIDGTSFRSHGGGLSLSYYFNKQDKW